MRNILLGFVFVSSALLMTGCSSTLKDTSQYMRDLGRVGKDVQNLNKVGKDLGNSL
ncbi:MAG: hypothetical protein ACRBDL_09240 [Alphaproteobacteria bacterium]